MSYGFRLPVKATLPAPACSPPVGLPGLEGRFATLSRLVTVPGRSGSTTATGTTSQTWHLLDNSELLTAAGIEPVGTVLCVHGNPTWSYLWRKLVRGATEQALAGHTPWRVIAVDQLEMGYSERFGVTHTLADRVADLGALTDHLRITGPVITVGHDWGGVVSLGWAVDHQPDLGGVILLNTAVHQDEEDRVPAALRLALARGVLTAGTVQSPGFLDTTLALARPRLAGDVRAAFRAPYSRAHRRGGIGGFVADIPATSSHPSHSELERIAQGATRLGLAGVPSLILWGPHDPVFQERYLQDLINRFPGGNVHRFEGAGHLLPEDAQYVPPVLHWLEDRVHNHPEEPHSNPPADLSPGPTPIWGALTDQNNSDHTALVEMAPPIGEVPRVVSWCLLSKRVDQIARGLLDLGAQPGSRVSLLIPPGADLTTTLYACLRIGAVVVVADAGLGLRGLTRAVKGAHPDFLIGAVPGLTAARALRWPGTRISVRPLSPPLKTSLGVTTSLVDLVTRSGATPELPPGPAPDEVAAVLFTSGSTGPAKGVVYTHRQLQSMRDVLATQYNIGPGTGLVAGFAPFALLGPALGARSVTPDMDVTAPATLTARAVAAAITAADAKVVFLSPAAVRNVIATRAELTETELAALQQVELFLSAGAPISPELLVQIAALMPNASAHTPYGMTEALLVTDVELTQLQQAIATCAPLPGGVCVGHPNPRTTVRISALDHTGQATGQPTSATGITGEVLIRAAHVKQRYDRLWFTEHSTRLPDPDADPTGPGWHRTGDVGHFDPCGQLWIEGRLSHVITTPHGPITPVGPEQRIETLPDVAAAAVVGIGPTGTQQPVAIVQPTGMRTARPRIAEPELLHRIRQISGIDVVAALVIPKMPTDVRHNSKIDRTRLSNWAGRVLAGGRITKP